MAVTFRQLGYIEIIDERMWPPRPSGGIDRYVRLN